MGNQTHRAALANVHVRGWRNRFAAAMTWADAGSGVARGVSMSQWFADKLGPDPALAQQGRPPGQASAPRSAPAQQSKQAAPQQRAAAPQQRAAAPVKNDPPPE